MTTLSQLRNVSDRGVTRSRVKGSEFGVPTLLTVIGACLMFGHLLLKEYMPSATYGILGFVLVAGVLFSLLMVRRDVFGFVLVIYVLSHFAYADNQGGLWNLLSFGLALIYLTFVNRHDRLRKPDLLIDLLLIVFVLTNAAGWIVKNPMPVTEKALGAASLLSYVLIFRLVGNLPLDPQRVRRFLLVTAVMVTYLLLVGINQRYAFFNINTPLLGAYSAKHGAITYGSTNAQGTFRHSELYGEYSVLMLALLVPFLSASLTQRVLKIPMVGLLCMAILCVGGVLITSTRSTAILTVFVCAIYFVVLQAKLIAAIDSAARQTLMLLLGLALVASVGAFVGLESLREDLEQLGQVEFSTESVLSGKALNRGGLFDLAMERMQSESWIIGFGHGIYRSNLWAWLGADPKSFTNRLADFHQLYVSLPMLYGWMGSAAFLLLVLIIASRVFITLLQHRRKRNILLVMLTGFSMFWFVFLADQYKISILRNSGYTMMFWIWLGLSNAAVKTLRRDMVAARQAKGAGRESLMVH